MNGFAPPAGDGASPAPAPAAAAAAAGCSGDDKSAPEALLRQLSRASVFDDSDDEEQHQSKLAEGYLGPIVPLKEHLERDKEDESLRRWKEQLLGSLHLEPFNGRLEPEVKLTTLTVISEGRPNMEVSLPLSSNSKCHAFTLKEGSSYSLKFTFSVHHNLVSGLTYINTVWKNGLRGFSRFPVEHSRTMLGTFAPQQDTYTHTTEEETTPSGILARGSYSAKMKLIDDDKRCYLDADYSFEIRKEWD